MPAINPRITPQKSTVIRTCQKPWSINLFELNRPEICDFVRNNVLPLIHDDETRRILIDGDVKSGKREIVEYIAMRDENNPRIKHIFISAFHRKADKTQREELGQHNLTVFSLSSKKVLENAIEFINRNLLSSDTKIIIHFDECDFGTGNNQIVSKLWYEFKNNNNIKFLLYSATGEEVRLSEQITQDSTDDSFMDGFYEEGVCLKFTPPDSYCGAKKFLDEGLVIEATPFFKVNEYNNIELTPQSKKIMKDAIFNLKEQKKKKRKLEDLLDKAEEESNEAEMCRFKKELEIFHIKNIIPVRLSYYLSSEGILEEKKAIYRFINNIESIPELKNVQIIVDNTDDKKNKCTKDNVTEEPVQWSSLNYWDQKSSEKLILIIYDQTSSRSTEWKHHDRIFAVHDFSSNITYSSNAQKQLRISHYIGTYGSFQRIKVYGHVKTFQLAAEQISVNDFLIAAWKMKKVRGKWNIVNSSTNEPHSEFVELSRYEAEYKLIELGSIKTKISTRLKGTPKRVKKLISEFFPGNPETGWLQIKQSIENYTEEIKNDDSIDIDIITISRNYRCPKIKKDGDKYEGNLRGWYVLKWEDTEEEKGVENSHWGFSPISIAPRSTICYNDGVLGVGVRWPTNEIIDVGTVETYKSMY